MLPVDYPAEPAALWRHFYQLSQLPRPSGQEAAVRQYAIDLAQAGGHAWQTDGAGNLVVRVAGSSAAASRETPAMLLKRQASSVRFGNGSAAKRS